jgi:HD-GYP domain-containing protein (c-di-GMP phosphodiesterase class II)
LLFVHPGVTRKLREDRMGELNAEELQQFESYPLKSLNLVLDRKLQLEEKLRNLVVTMHARADGKGFPRGGSGGGPRKMTQESQFLGLAYEMDRRSLVRLGQPRRDPEQVLREILDEESARPARFSTEFTLQVRAGLA